MQGGATLHQESCPFYAISYQALIGNTPPAHDLSCPLCGADSIPAANNPQAPGFVICQGCQLVWKAVDREIYARLVQEYHWTAGG